MKEQFQKSILNYYNEGYTVKITCPILKNYCLLFNGFFDGFDFYELYNSLPENSIHACSVDKEEKIVEIQMYCSVYETLLVNYHNNVFAHENTIR